MVVVYVGRGALCLLFDSPSRDVRIGVDGVGYFFVTHPSGPTSSDQHVMTAL